MNEKQIRLRQKELYLTCADLKNIEQVAMALDSSIRLKIISLLIEKSYTLIELTKILNISMSNASFHVKLLKEAGLINQTHNSSKKGNEKIIALEKHSVHFDFNLNDNQIPSFEQKSYTTEIPIGSYCDCDITAPCGLGDENGRLIGKESQPEDFYDYKKINAQIIWFVKGYLEYHIPNGEYKNKKIKTIEISCELCSECANFKNDYKSDINFYLNNKKVGTYTSLGDFGGRQGKYSPSNWPSASTQYGKLVQIRIDSNGCYINENLINNDLTINDFQDVATTKYLSLKIACEDDSKYVGGINIFGNKFGDYAQSIRITVSY